jgi:hypothetical protein|tara:strand:- start:210 stop:446 length:237 start_codon:yes stop_codon:yes gene_type:complete
MKHKPTQFVPDSLIVKEISDDFPLLNQKTKDLEQNLIPLLGSPYYSKNGLILYKGDFVSVAKKILNSSVKIDLTVTSP